MKPISFYLAGALRASLALPLYAISYIIPRDPKQMIIGAWQGKLYCDNSKYFMLYVLEHTDFKVTWIGNKEVEHLLPKHPNLRFAIRNSPKAIWAALRAKTWLYCWGMYFDLNDFPVRGHALVINLWHGIPVKFVGRKSFNGRNPPRGSILSRLYLALMHLGGDASYLVTASDKMTEVLADGMPTIFSARKAIKSGTPRNDFLINNTCNKDLISSLKKKYAKFLGFDPNKKIVLYLPTHRNDGQYTFAFFDAPQNEQECVKRILDDNNAVLIEKHHFLTLQNFPNVKPSICAISIPADKQLSVDIQELLLVTDVLISDYSGAFIDFALLKRPTIHFAYDYQHYVKDDSGMAYKLDDYAAGSIVNNMTELVPLLNECLSRKYFNPKSCFNQLVSFEKGHACDSLVAFIRRECH